MERKTAETVVKVFAVLNWLGSALAIFSGLMLLLLGATSMFSLPGTDAAFLLFLGPILGLLLILFGVAGGVVGYGLWHHKNWARITVMVLAVLTLFSFPLGTIIGALEIWLFGFDKDIKALFNA